MNNRNNNCPDELRIAPLPVPTSSPPTSRIGKWLFHPELSEIQKKIIKHETKPWYQVIWLTGVDYFSTLGYQPGIALLAAGAISPLATLILVLVTLFCALPTYSQVAKRSYNGEGSISILENLLKGWSAKFFVLVMLGFASTDFIITITLSAADAALHLAENPLAHAFLGDSRMAITIALMALLAAVFLRGFKEAIGLASLIAIPYIILNFVVLFVGFDHILHQPELIFQWQLDITKGTDWTSLFIVSALVFPKLALGMSGFETGVSVMPLVEGDDHGVEDHQKIPLQRISNTRKLLTFAAVLMCFLLLISSLVTTILIPPSAYQAGGEANGRAISYLAHHLLGNGFGTVYDFSTIFVLWFAGASAMAGMLNLLPKYLPRFGMAPDWSAYRRPLVIALFIITVIVTWIFKADVDAQGSAYATGVLALMLSAAVAVALSLWREGKFQKLKSLYYFGVAIIFAYTFLDNVFVKPDGLFIGCVFIVMILIMGVIYRWQRSLEFRVEDVFFQDAKSKEVWSKIADQKVHLVPVASNEMASREYKAKEVRKHYRLDGKIAFLNVHLSTNRSEFLSALSIKAREDLNGDVMIEVSGAIALANSIAYISELLNPGSLFIGLTRTNLTSQALNYLILGEGETGLLVYRILLRYWEWTSEDDVRPLIFLMSD
ncbi:MAG: hypothetical protein QE271_00295 [Bacteriovoracaceae bacterium]|nr:hypothetical protein [Bacteriovoracaceae bacterium]